MRPPMLENGDDRVRGPTGSVRDPIHPGEVLGDELSEAGISHERLARDIDVSGSTVSRIVALEQAITADMALRLAHWFGTSPQFWINLQTQYDLRVAESKIGDDLKSLPTRELMGS